MTLYAEDIYKGKVTTEQLRAQPIETLQKNLIAFRSEREELNREYSQGDNLCYPSDWYDHD